MKRTRSAESLGGRWRRRPSHAVIALAAVYLLFISFKSHHLLEIATLLSGDDDTFSGIGIPLHHLQIPIHGDSAAAGINAGPNPPLLPSESFHRKLEDSWRPNPNPNPNAGSIALSKPPKYHGNLTELEKVAREAWDLGLKAWQELQIGGGDDFNQTTLVEGNMALCPSSVLVDGEEGPVAEGDRMVFLPCGLAAGSAITVVGTPHDAHEEYVPELAAGAGPAMVSQFVVELQGLKVADGEDPPRIFHLNPRLRGDWSHVPVIEHNTCYREQWGSSMRCDGLASKDDDDTVDGFIKCEKWVRSDIVDPKESKTTSWLRRFIGRAKKPAMTWPFPFMERRLFVLTLQAGVEGYHIYVGGRHVTSFPYRIGFSLEDATGLAVKGNLDVHSVYATSLPTSHRSFSPQQVLEMSEKWKSPPLPGSPVNLFIGILSASNHFAERMAIRKTWLQFPEIKSSDVVARFFVALNQRKEVNAVLKLEAEYFGDIVILPFMDRYDLVVLKTIAICEYGVSNLTAAYIMKCDDDNFVRVDAVLKEIKSVAPEKSLYMGNLNLLHRPLRTGKWAVTLEEWPEAIYPPYANGPGYIISRDIANFIAAEHASRNLWLFKMEDVSMGMWVEQFNASSPVRYSHSWRFCQYGCTGNYYSAHYQSPRQMFCLWHKLAKGRAQCCNFR